MGSTCNLSIEHLGYEHLIVYKFSATKDLETYMYTMAFSEILSYMIVHAWSFFRT